MPSASTPLYGLPYLIGTSNGKDLKNVSKSLAEKLEATLKNKGSIPLDADLAAILTRLGNLEGGVPNIPWTVATTMNGYTPHPDFPPRYCVRGGILWLSGSVYRATAPTLETAFMIPYGPLGQVRAAGRHDLSQYVAITSSREVKIVASGPSSGGAGYTLDGIGFAL